MSDKEPTKLTREQIEAILAKLTAKCQDTRNSLYLEKMSELQKQLERLDQKKQK
jgi:hypothetical protein